MATVAPPTKGPAPRPESFVEQQLRSARGRIVLRDVLTAGLVLALITLVYGVTMVLLDVNLHLPGWARQLGFFGYLLGAGAFTWFMVVRPLIRPVNPFFAAKQVEMTVPNAKNSVINWLDLHDEELPEATKAALGVRAAKALKQADLNEAIPQRSVAWLGGAVTAATIVALIVLIKFGGMQLGSLISRAFAPFTKTAIAAQTTLTVVEPAGGNLTISLNRLNQTASSVAVTVNAEGRIPEPGQPDAIRILFRYSNDEPLYDSRPMEVERSDNRVWRLRFPASLVQNGFWYKVAVGTEGSANYAETPEYRVQVRANPLVKNFTIAYHYRPYLRRKDDIIRGAPDGDVAGLRGTEVTVTAYTNRTIRDGKMVFVGTPETVVGQLVPGEPSALRFQFVLEHSGRYQVQFTSNEGEPTVEPLPEYDVKVGLDLPPVVRFTEPKDEDSVKLPPDGVLKLAGVADDDFGLTRMELKMQLKGGPTIRTKVYREGKSFQFADGSYPKQLDYRDFVELDKLVSADGKALPLTPGQELEYWLEATDNCDYPHPNVGRTQKTYRVVIVPKKADETPQQRQQEKQQAQQEQTDHEQQQDQRLQQQNQQAQQQQKQGGQPGDKKNEQQPDGQGQQQNKPGDPKQQGQQQQGQPNGKPQQTKQDGQQQQGQPQQQGKPNGKPQPGQPQNQQQQKGQGQPQQENQGTQGATADPQQPKQGSGQPQSPMKNTGPKNSGTGGPQQGDPTTPQQKQSQGASGQPTDPATAKKDDETQKQAERIRRAIQQQQAGNPPNAQANPQPKQGPGTQAGKPEPKPMGEQGTQQPKDPMGTQGKSQAQQNQGASKPGQPKQSPNAAGQQGTQQPKNPMGAQSNPPAPQNQGATKPGEPKPPTGTTGQQQQQAKPQAGQPQQKPMGGDPQQNQGATGQPKQLQGPMGTPGQPKPKEGGTTGQPQRQSKPMGKQSSQSGDQPKPQAGQPQSGEPKPSPGQQSAGTKPDAATQQKVQQQGQQPGPTEKNPKPQASASQPKPSGTAQQKPPQAGEPKAQNQSPSACKDPQSGNCNNPRTAGNQKPGQSGSGQSSNQRSQTAQNQSPNPGGQAGPGKKPQAQTGQQQTGAPKPGGPSGSQSAKNNSQPLKSGSAPTAEDVKKMAEALKNGTAQVRRQAADQLDQARKQAGDPATQKAAEEALKEAARQGNKEAQEALAGNDRGQPKPQDTRQANQGQPGSEPQAGGPKPMPGAQQPMGSNERPGTQASGPKPMGQGNQPNTTEQPGGRGSQAKPGEEFRPGQGGGGADLGPGQKPDLDFQKRAGELQLDEFRKKAKDKDLLKRAGLSEQEYQQFLKGYEEMLRRQAAQRQAEGQRQFAPGSRSGPSRLNTGAQRVRPGGEAKPGDLANGGQFQAPPEYRKAYQEFTEELGKTKPDKR